jgi:hypothetical protein
MANYQRTGNHEDDTEFVPFTARPAHEEDVADEHLPTIDEAEPVILQRRTEGHSQWVRAQLQANTAASANEIWRDPKEFLRIMRRGKRGFICIVMTPGIALTIVAVVVYQLLAQTWLTLVGKILSTRRGLRQWELLLTSVSSSYWGYLYLSAYLRCSFSISA